LKNSSETTI